MGVILLFEDDYPFPSMSLIKRKYSHSFNYPYHVIVLSPFIIKTALLCVDLIMSSVSGFFLEHLTKN